MEAGYPRTVAQCVDNPPEGGMGYHHIHSGLLDARIELERPEILVYERAADGGYALVDDRPRGVIEEGSPSPRWARSRGRRCGPANLAHAKWKCLPRTP